MKPEKHLLCQWSQTVPGFKTEVIPQGMSKHVSTSTESLIGELDKRISYPPVFIQPLVFLPGIVVLVGLFLWAKSR